MSEAPDDRTLASALEAELRTLADSAPPELRLRLLVAAHTAGLLAHDDEPASGGEDADLAAALRAGVHDDELPAVAARLRTSARA